MDTVPERLEMSKKMGANVVINAKEKDPIAEILALTGSDGVDVAVEAVGTQATFEACTRVVRRGGTVSSIGVYGLTPQLSMPTNVSSLYHRKIVTTLCPSGHDRMASLLAMLQYGDIDLTPLFTHRMKLAEKDEQIQALENEIAQTSGAGFQDEGKVGLATRPFRKAVSHRSPPLSGAPLRQIIRSRGPAPRLRSSAPMALSEAYGVS